MDVALVNANLVDSTSTEPQLGVSVLIREGCINQVTRSLGRTALDGAEVIDLAGAWLLPGLWDVHSHMIWPRWAPRDEPLMERFIRQGSESIAAFQMGITGQRVLGAADFSDVAWKRAFDRGLFLGPRLMVAGYLLEPTGGHMWHHPETAKADGADGFRRLVREQIKAGADLIKIAITGGVAGSAQESTDDIQMSPDELEAVFETASDRGLPVAVHAGNPRAVKAAVRLGARSIEHGYKLDEEAVSLMAQRGTYFVPTLRVTNLTEEAATGPHEKAHVARYPYPPLMRQRCNAVRPAHVQALQMALAAGVRIASGSDATLVDTSLIEIELLVRCGMTPMQALVAATKHGAEVAGLGDRLGTVEPGKLADLVVMAKGPLEDISNIRTVVMVFKGGQLVVDKRGLAH